MTLGMYWLGKRSTSQYVDIKYGELSVPHKTFDQKDAEKALREFESALADTGYRRELGTHGEYLDARKS